MIWKDLKSLFGLLSRKTCTWEDGLDYLYPTDYFLNGHFGMFSLVNIASDMNYKRIEFWAGLGFLALAVYMLTKGNHWDAALYIAAAIAFSINGLLKENVFPGARKLLVVLAWIFIGLTLFLFLFLLRTD